MNTKALIVKVKITKPGQSETDEELTAEVHSAHGMKEGAGRYTRALYPPDAFNPVKTVESKVRRYFRAEQGKRLIHSVLGWICPAPHVERHHARIAELEAEFWPAVEKIKESWPSIIAQCRIIQAGRFNLDDYPRQDQVRSHFGFIHIPTPMPNPDTIGDLDFLMQERATQIREQMRENIERAAQDGSAQAMSRVLEYVNRIATILSKPDPTVHDKLIENLGEVLDLAPGLNLAGDPAINQIVAVCRQKLLVAPEALRTSALQRRIVSSAAKNITAQFSGVGQRRLAA